MGRRPAEADSAVRVFSIWRRAAPVHREFLRAHGSGTCFGDDRAAVPVSAGRGPSGGAAGVDHAAPAARDSRRAGGASRQEPSRERPLTDTEKDRAEKTSPAASGRCDRAEMWKSGQRQRVVNGGPRTAGRETNPGTNEALCLSSPNDYSEG